MKREETDKQSSRLFTHTCVRKMSVVSVGSGSGSKEQNGVEWVSMKAIGLAYA